MDIPLLGMGTWGMGGKYERDETNIEESIAALRYGLDLGIKLIDTAELYGAGLTEEIVGQAIKGYNREDIFITTKVWKDNLHYDDVLKAARQSLERLQTSYIDLYLIHWPNPDISLVETIRALEELVLKGLVKQIGVSNFSVELMREAQSYLKKTVIFANQIEYNLFNRENDDVVSYCQSNNIKVIAYRPLAKGSLNEKYAQLLVQLSDKYHKTARQIMINWLTSQDIVAIPKAINIEHIAENYESLGWEIEASDVDLLNF